MDADGSFAACLTSSAFSCPRLPREADERSLTSAGVFIRAISAGMGLLDIRAADAAPNMSENGLAYSGK